MPCCVVAGAPGTPASVAAAPEPEVNPAAAQQMEGAGQGMHVGEVVGISTAWCRACVACIMEANFVGKAVG